MLPKTASHHLLLKSRPGLYALEVGYKTEQHEGLGARIVEISVIVFYSTSKNRGTSDNAVMPERNFPVSKFLLPQE